MGISQSEKLKAAAKSKPISENLIQNSLTLSMDMYIDMLLESKKHLSNLEEEIDALAKNIEEYKFNLSPISRENYGNNYF